MAFSGVVSRGFGVRTTSGTDVTKSPDSAIAVGKICIVQVVTDNIATSDGSSSNHTLSDTDGHTWTKVYEHTDSAGAALDGSTTSLWWTKVTSEIGTSDVITCTINGSITAGILCIVEASVASGYTVKTILSTIASSDSATTLSASLSSLTSREYLYIGSFGAEGADLAKTPISGYTELHDRVSSADGSATLNVQAHVAYKIETSTGTTWTSLYATFTNGTQAVVAFYEVVDTFPITISLSVARLEIDLPQLVLYVYGESMAFGEENPTEGELSVSWQTWQNTNEENPGVVGDGDWGKLKLLYPDAEVRSLVYDLENTDSKKITLAKNEYGIGSDNFIIEIRGDSSTFGRNDSTPTWITYSEPVDKTWRYLQIRIKYSQSMLGMWLQPEDIDTKAEIDAIITYSVAHGVTDLFASFVDWNTNPKTTLGDSTLGNITSKTADGKYPFTYLTEQAVANGIRVHAWVVVHFAYHWCGSSAVLDSPLTDNSTNHDTSNGGSCINFANFDTRDAITDFFADIASENPGISSITLDYIRTDGVVTGIDLDDVTDFVSELRAKTSVPISVCSLANKYAVTSFKQDSIAWITSGYIDMIVTMGYEYAYGVKWQYISGFDWSSNPSKTLMWGLGAMVSTESPSDLEFHLKKYGDIGYKNFSIFSWADDLKDNSDYDDVLDDLATNTLNPTMGAITKITVTPSTSIVLTIGGTAYTTTYSNASSYTTAGTLKRYIESVEGARPFVYYMRKTTSTIQIMVGEFEP